MLCPTLKCPRARTPAVVMIVLAAFWIPTSAHAQAIVEIVTSFDDPTRSGLDVEYASTDDGARVIQYTPHGGANQQWLLRPVESPAAPITTVSER